MFARLQPGASGSSRKRQKLSHDSANDEQASFGTIRRTATPQPQRHDGDKGACHHEQALARLQPDLDAMRSLVTCKICQRFLSEPYSLSCGHTYCYVCLDAWLVAQKKRTCPDCRASIRQEPTPSFIIREMTMIFTSRPELLPDGETMEEHDEYIKEAAATVAKDKASGTEMGSGLFKGIFSRMHAIWEPLRDQGDHVDRCPSCFWELEEGICSGCGMHVGDQDGFGLSEEDGTFSSDSDESEELDHDIDAHDDDLAMPEDYISENEDGIDYDLFGALPRAPAPNRPLGARSTGSYRARRRRLAESDESSSEDDSEEDSEMEGFIDDEAGEALGSGTSDDESDEEEEARSTPHRRVHRRAPVVIDDDDDDVAEGRRTITIDSDADSDDEGPVVLGSQRAKTSRGNRRSQPVAFSDEEDASSSDGDDESEEDDDEHDAIGTGFSPPRYNQFEDGYDMHDHDDHDNDGDEEVDNFYGDDYDAEGEHWTAGFGMDGGDSFNPEEADDDDGSMTAGFAPFAFQPESRRADFSGRADMRAETPVIDRPVQPAPSHRLQTRQHHRTRHSSRRNERQGSPNALPAPTHPFNLGNTLAAINSQQRGMRQRRRDRQNEGSVLREQVGRSDDSDQGGVDVEDESDDEESDDGSSSETL